MYSNVHCFCFVLFFHFIILIRQSKRSFDEICQRETGFKEKKKNQTTNIRCAFFTLAYGTGLKRVKW